MYGKVGSGLAGVFIDILVTELVELFIELITELAV